MRVKLILPALTEATSPLFRPIKYSLFPPLGLATLAGYLDPNDEAEIQDEHVERLRLDDEPDLVGIQVYITSARRAYEIADLYRRRGVHVALGGLHVTSLPEEAVVHADSIFLGPGEDTWPAFLRDFRAGRPLARYVSTVRTLDGLPPIRRDLIRRGRYLVPNSLVVSRGCPHRCDTRHTVFRPARMSVEELEAGYWGAYRDFYRWSAIWAGAATEPDGWGTLRHLGYAAGWKKFEPLWDLVIRLRRLPWMLPVLEGILQGHRKLIGHREASGADDSPLPLPLPQP